LLDLIWIAPLSSDDFGKFCYGSPSVYRLLHK
jgi:hypothetical protein